MPKTSETLRLNSIDLYYEAYGEGEPLLLLHGWTQSSQFWTGYIEAFAKNYEVYALDLRGHGRTSPLTEDFSIQKAAEDVAVFIDHLGLKSVRAIGLSYGGLALLQLEHLHPGRIKAMVLIGAAHRYSGKDNPNLDKPFSFEDLPDEFIEQLRQLHPRGDSQIRALFKPELNYEIRLSEEEVKAIQTKTLIINGDHDEILGIESAFELYKFLPNANL